MTTPSLLSSNEMKNLDDPERYPNSHVDAKWESDYRQLTMMLIVTPAESMF
jgi:hypothetical protein